MNIFDCAIKMEEDARAHYQQLAEATDDQELKNLFAILAEAEQEHHDALVQLKTGINSKSPKFKALQETACLLNPMLAQREQMAGLKKDPDAYQAVIRREQRSIEFYHELAAQIKDKEARKIVLSIADEERRHLSIIENIYSFVESPKNFLAWGEFSNLKEY
ncbi:ferritin-like domain-containing protein [Geomonas subterranea]|uniref:Ferritin family protein n=1 Tax=Geomonas subterranea TaxID=2847989 RepID=A0ABX8LLA3_9BACT|nr:MULTISPECIES: ferritin family protein [Geomonas]QXE92473.1 ferritin family protein [Geomonas subterranea]QXM09428.1 ferritin family protein [Geomonas subterranea]